MVALENKSFTASNVLYYGCNWKICEKPTMQVYILLLYHDYGAVAWCNKLYDRKSKTNMGESGKYEIEHELLMHTMFIDKYKKIYTTVRK